MRMHRNVLNEHNLKTQSPCSSCQFQDRSPIGRKDLPPALSLDIRSKIEIGASSFGPHTLYQSRIPLVSFSNGSIGSPVLFPINKSQVFSPQNCQESRTILSDFPFRSVRPGIEDHGDHLQKPRTRSLGSGNDDSNGPQIL